MQTVSWFSAGVSSAVATKLAIGQIDKVFYIHVDDQHPDTLRFVKEREIGGSCINGTYLDELDPFRGRKDGPIVDDCGIYCEMLSL